MSIERNPFDELSGQHVKLTGQLRLAEDAVRRAMDCTVVPEPETIINDYVIEQITRAIINLHHCIDHANAMRVALHELTMLRQLAASAGTVVINGKAGGDAGGGKAVADE